MYAPTTSKASTTSQGTYIMTSRESKAPKTKFNDIYYIPWHLTPQASWTPTTHNDKYDTKS